MNQNYLCIKKMFWFRRFNGREMFCFSVIAKKINELILCTYPLIINYYIVYYVICTLTDNKHHYAWCICSPNPHAFREILKTNVEVITVFYSVSLDIRKSIALLKVPWLLPLVLLTRRILWGVTAVMSLIKAIHLVRR